MNVSRALLRWRFIRFLCAGAAMTAALAAAEGAAQAGNVTVLSAGAPSPQASGVPFNVDVRMQSSGISDNVCATLFTGASGGSVTVSKPTTRCAGTLQDGQVATLTWQVTFTLASGQTHGSVNFVASVSWTGGSTVFSGATVNVVPPSAPAQLSIASVTPSPTTVFTGQSITVTVPIINSAAAGSDSANIAQVTLVESTGGSNPSCGPPSADGSGPLAPQATRTFTFSCQSAVSGSFRMAAQVTGTDATTGQALQGGPLSSSIITVNSPAAGLLVSSVAPTPLAATDGQAIVVDVFVKNTALPGGHDATSVTPGLQANVPTTGNASADCILSSAADSSPLPPQTERRFSYACTAAGYGQFTFHGMASGFDGPSPLSGAGDSAALTITDDQSPSVTINPSPVPWSAMDVTFELVASDNDHGSGVASITVQIDGGPLTPTLSSNVSVTLSAEGAHTVSFFATDQAGNNSTTTAVTAGVDKTPPSIAGGQTPPANGAGWNNAAVTVSFTCSDATSGVRSCSAPVSLAAETAGTSVPGSAVDNAGNVASASWGPVRIDLTPPAISGAPVQTANGAGWYAQPVTVHFSCTDALSGIAICPGDLVVSSEGAAQSVAGTATDVAGNSSSANVGALNIDLTPPVVSTTRAPGANANGWNNGDVTVTFSCSDALSGVATCPAAAVLSSEGANQSASGSATDRAGNSGNGRVDGVSIDRTPPNIDVATAPAANAAGWNNSDVTATFTCADALSGIGAGACPAPQSYASDGTFSASGSVEDRAGNTASASAPVHLDKTAPTVGGSRAPAANGAGWNNVAVTVSFTCADALSGVASCAAPKTLAGEGAGQSASGSATDVAGNAASTTVGNVNIDLTAPTITTARLPAPNFTGWNNTPVTVHFGCADALSGVAACTPDLLLAAEGVFTAAGVAVDRAGNQTPADAMVPISIDLTPPTVMVPGAPIVTEATGPGGAAVPFDASASDTLSGYLPGSLGCASGAGAVQSGAVFPVGDSVVTCAAMDLAGNVGAASFTVSVRDTTAPVLSTVADVTAEATSGAGAVVSYTTPTATDLVDGAVAVSCDHASGSTFPVGTTQVLCSATDAHGNTGTTSFQVTVQSTSPPTIGKVPGTNAQNQLIAYATSVLGATVSYTLPPATDSFGHALAVQCAPAPGSKFAPGQTTVTCSATDSLGRHASATFTVWVQFQVTADAATGTNFLQPINPDGSSIFKLGTVIPTRFRLTGASAAITNLVANFGFVKTSSAIEGTKLETVCSEPASSGTRFHYESSDKYYEFNWSTKYQTQGTYRVSADLGDGVVHTIRVSIKK